MTDRNACLVFGSRRGVPTEVVREFIFSLPQDTVIIVGTTPMDFDLERGEGVYYGVDYDAMCAALERRMSVVVIPAHFDVYSRPAGPIRNGWMLRALKAGPGNGQGFRASGKSNGTDDMFKKIRMAGVGAVLDESHEWK